MCADEENGLVAKIESIVTDQGGGGGYCNECQTFLGNEPIKFPDFCPGCNRRLVWGNVFFSRGGSDYEV